MHACKQMGHEANFKEARQGLELKTIDADITRQAYTKESNASKSKRRIQKERWKSLLQVIQKLIYGLLKQK